MTGTEFLSLVGRRQSTRGYQDKPVEEEILARCLEAARLSPSACNAQPWKFIVVDNTEIRHEIAQATSSKVLQMNHFTMQAPLLVVIVMEKANFTSRMGQVLKDKEYPLMDIGIATENFCLQATAEGLGTCILGWFDEPKVKHLLNIPGNKRVPLIITLGYPSSLEIRPKKRKSIPEIVSRNSYTGQ